jgi:hypothetical protein
MSEIRVVNNTFLNVQQAVFVQPLGGQKASDVQLANNLCLDDDPLISHLTPQFDLRATDGVITSGFVRNNYFHGFEREKGVMQFGDSTLDLMPSTQIFRYAAGASPEPLPILANGPDPVPYFRLRPALVDLPNAAIDAGVVLAGYTDGVPGPPDIGAFEWYANDPTPLSPLTIFREGTQLALRWSSTAGSSYLIEASSTLASGSWTTATGPILADALRTETAFLLPAEPVAAHRYYRVRKTQ